MFFVRYIDEAWANVQSELVAPPANGKYHAFEAYPLADYIRIADKIARARFPGSTREAYRLLARGEVEVFAESTLGKVTFSMMRDPEVALLRYPELMQMLSRGPTMHASRVAPKRVAIMVERFTGSAELTVGTLEGLAMSFDVVPALDIDIANDRRAVFTVSWA